MKLANIAAAIVITVWLWLAYQGHASLRPFLLDETPDWPTMTSIDSHILFPMLMAMALASFAFGCNALGRWPMVVAAASFASFAAILPYLAITGGGV